MADRRAMRRRLALGAAAFASLWVSCSASGATLAIRQIPSILSDLPARITPRPGIDRILPPAGLSLLRGAVGVAVPAQGAQLNYLVTVEPAPRVEGANFGYTMRIDADGKSTATICEYALLLAPGNADQAALNEQLRAKAPTFGDAASEGRLSLGPPSSAPTFALQAGVLFFVRRNDRIDAFLGVAPASTGERLNYLLALRDGRTAAVEVTCMYNGGAGRFDAVDFGRSRIVVSFER